MTFRIRNTSTLVSLVALQGKRALVMELATSRLRSISRSSIEWIS